MPLYEIDFLIGSIYESTLHHHLYAVYGLSQTSHQDKTVDHDKECETKGVNKGNLIHNEGFMFA